MSENKIKIPPNNIKKDIKIAFSGKMGSGKTTAALYICNKYKNLNFKKIAFADSIKKIAINVFGFSKQEVYITKPENARLALQYIGHVGRLSHPDFWINKTIDEKGNLIIDDMRFKREFEVLKKQNWILIRINATRDIRKKRVNLVNETDKSETELDHETFDYVIENNKTLKDFYEEIDEVMKCIL